MRYLQETRDLPSSVPADRQQNGGSSNSNKVIIIVVCLVAFIVIKSGLAIYCFLRHKRKRAERLHKLTSKHKSGTSESELLSSYDSSIILDKSEVRLLKNPNGSLRELGAGSFGRVLLGICHEVQPVAVKMLHPKDNVHSKSAFEGEVAMMKFVSRNRHIVQFYGVWPLDDGGMGLVTELMEGGDLRTLIGREKPPPITWWNGGKQVALDIARGLVFLHTHKVIHRDLKTSNVLITAEGVAKIGDVGLAKIQTETTQGSTAVVGTLAFMAPEMLLGERCTPKMDIYSAGVVLWEIATGKPAVRGHVLLPLDSNEAPPELCAIIEACMHRDPDQRPSSQALYRLLEACPSTWPSVEGKKLESGGTTPSLLDTGTLTASQTASGTGSPHGSFDAADLSGQSCGASLSKNSIDALMGKGPKPHVSEGSPHHMMHAKSPSDVEMGLNYPDGHQDR
eukprot:jgi/Botrbrau1/22753/Bobra.0132s0085.1